MDMWSDAVRRPSETAEDFIRGMLTDEEAGEAFAKAFLKAAYLTSAVDALLQARREAQLSQAKVAEQIKTRQSAIARWEADTSGAMTLSRYADFALACERVPLVMLARAQTVRAFLQELPGAPLTAETFLAWRNMRNGIVPAVGNMLVPVTGKESCARTVSALREQDASNAVLTAEQILRGHSRPVALGSTGSTGSNVASTSTDQRAGAGQGTLVPASW